MLADEYNKAAARKDYKGKTDEELHDIAYSEVVAQCCETLLSDTDAVSRLASQIKAENKTLWDKICEFFSNLAEALKNAYEGLAPGSEIANQAKDTIQNVERLRDLWASAGAGAIKNYTSSSKVGNDGNGNAQRIGKNGELRSERIVDQMKHSMDSIMQMKSVASISKENAVPFLASRLENTKAGAKVFASQGGTAVRKGYGTVHLTVNGAKESIFHGNGPAKQATFPAIKAVIEQGVEVGRDYNHNGKGFDTVTFAAPIDFFGNKEALGVVVKEFNNAVGEKNFYIHEICDENGNYIKLDNGIVTIKEKVASARPNPKSAADATYRGNSSAKTIAQKDDGVKMYSVRDYSYDALVSKPDMEVTTVSGNVPKNRADVVYQAKQNAAKIGKFNTKDGSVSVHVKDIDRDVILGTYGLKHSLDRRMEVNAPVTMMAGKIIRNSIKINELTPEKSEADESYVLIGAARNDSGELYVVRSVVNKFSNELSSMDVLYAINAKKGNRLRSMRPGFQGPVTDSTISISELLDYVNEYFPDILPEDVLKHYGHDARPDGKLGESALYSDRDDGGMSNRQLLANALESSVQHEAEAKRLAEYKENIRKVSELQMQLGDLNNQIKELSFAKGIKDTKKIRELRDEKIKTENRINVIDGALLRLESMQAIKNVLERERERARQAAEKKGRAALDEYRKSSEKKQSEIIDQPAAEEKPQRAFFIDYPRKVLVTSRRIGSAREKILIIQGYTVLRDRNTITRQKAVTPRGHSTARFRDTI